MSLLATHVHFRIPKYNKVKRELIKHCDVTLFTMKSSKRKDFKLEERKWKKTGKRSCHTVLKDLSNLRIKNFVSYTL